MEKENSIKNDSNTMPSFLKKNKMKLGGEENDKIFIANNSENNAQNTKDQVKFLFPDLSNNDINNVLERAEYNIEKTIELLKELKQEQRKNLEAKCPKLTTKRIKKRNYNDFMQSIKDKQDNDKKVINNNTSNINNNINNNISEIKENEINNNQINQIQSNNNSNDSNNNINLLMNSLDDEKKNLINRQMDFLLDKFSKMKDISELKNLLTEIGFPTKKEDIEKNKINVDEIKKQLDEKLMANKEEKKRVVNLYKKYAKTCDEIKEKEEKIEELNNTLVNLIGIETDQKIRKEYYENELQDNNNNYNDFLNGPREGY